MPPRPGPASNRTLEAEVEEFRADLVTMLAGVLKDSDVALGVTVFIGETEQTVTIQHVDRQGIKILIDGQVMFRLEVAYRCKWNDAGAYLAVEGSTYKVNLEATGRPLISFDYLRSPGSTIPASHINLHANSDEIVFAMMASGRKKRGKSRARTIKAGNVPRLADLHLPTGGHRFRPCLEDVAEMLVIEFGIDVKPGYQTALDQGRTKYRITQLRTAVSDAQADAAAILREQNWTVTPPDGWTPSVGSRFTAY